MNRKAVDQNFGADAQVTTDANGGRQAHLHGAFHLLPGKAMLCLVTGWERFGSLFRDLNDYRLVETAYTSLASLLKDDGDKENLPRAFTALCTLAQRMLAPEEPYVLPTLGLFAMAETIERGAAKYGINNWRRIDFPSQVNHALAHILAYLGGNHAEDHLGNALCRVAFAIEVDAGTYRFTAEPEPILETAPAHANVIPIDRANAFASDPQMIAIAEEALSETQRQTKLHGATSLRYRENRAEAGLIVAEEMLESIEALVGAGLRYIRGLNDGADTDSLRVELIQLTACGMSAIAALDTVVSRRASQQSLSS